MFRQKMLPWAKLVGLIASAMVPILAYTRTGPRPRNLKGTQPKNDMRIGPTEFRAQREIATTYIRLANVNR